MSELRQIVSKVYLKEVDGAPAISWAGFSLHARKAYTDGLGSDDIWPQLGGGSSDASRRLLTPEENLEGYRLFPNIDSAKELLMACEGFESPPIPQFLSGADIYERGVSVSDFVDPGALLDALGVKNHTSTKKREAKKVIESWCRPSEISAAIPIRDLLAMSKDLKAIVTMLLFTIGDACTAEMLRENALEGLTLLKAGDAGCEYYQGYVGAIPYSYMPGGVSGLREYYEQDMVSLIEAASDAEWDSAEFGEMREFCNRLISALMFPLAPVLTWNGFYAAGERASLAGAYAFWAHEALCGKAAVCERCGNLFIRKRSSGRFCRPACRVAAHEAPRR